MRSRGNIFIIVLVLALLAGTAALFITREPVLGLDLRGGSEIVLQAQPDPGVEVTPEIMNQAVAIYNKRLNSLGTTEPSIQKDGTDRITIQLPGEKNPDRVADLVGSTGTLYFLPLQDALTPGVSRSVVAGAGIQEKDSLWNLLQPVQDKIEGSTAYYAFDNNKRPRNRQAAKTPQQLLQQLQVTKLPAGWTQMAVPKDKIAVYCQPTENRSCPVGLTTPGKTYWYMFDLPAKDKLLTGKDLSTARADFDPSTGEPVVSMQFNDRGGKLFKEITGNLARQGKADFDAAKATDPNADPLNYVRQFTVILDGELETYPYIDFQRTPDGIGKDSQITGVTLDEAKDVATVLASGSLPVEFARLSQTQVSATLGKTSLEQGLFAGLAGLIVVMIWMIIFYRFLGVIADLALLIYAALYFGVILAIPVTLTLPGIAGLILTIGVAADANVVVFERIKEEVRAGRSVRASISAGYRKGFSTIIDANAVTLITASVLFVASQSSVRGFAFLLAIGVLVSMFTAVAATRAMLGILGGFKWFNNAAFMGATAKPVRWKIDVVGRTKMWFIISGAVVVISLGSLAIQGLNRGLDFTGGTRLAFAMTDKGGATVDEVRDIAKTIDPELGDAIIRGTGAPVSTDHYSGFQMESKEVHGAGRRRLPVRAEQEVRRERRAAGQVLADHRVRLVRPRDPAVGHPRLRLLDGADRRLPGLPVRLALRGAHHRGADPRPDHHARRVLDHRAGGDLGDRGRGADDPRLLAVRHDHRVRPRARERTPAATAHVWPDREHLALGDADALPEHEHHHAAADRQPVHLRR